MPKKLHNSTYVYDQEEDENEQY